MLDQRRVAAQPEESREQLFTERYQSLLAWAMLLSNQQRDVAEDLVQDAFVQFMLGRTKLEEIENIDGYLRRMLRYMHLARISRSAQHLHDAALSVADYDTCRTSWTAIEPPRRVQASEELHQICTYACSRKESSKSGSVLILRFFLEYFPAEIARILNSSRHSVDELQRFARREAKLFINEPRRLRFVDTRTVSASQQIKYLRSDCDVMLALRQMIVDSCHGKCLSRQELEQVYENGKADALATPELAHVVSCPKCLDVVNSILGLPLLSERYRSGPSNSKKPPREGGGSSGASGGGPSDGGELTQKFGHRLRETHEHKPHELSIAVNGALVSSLKVSSDLSELDLNLTPDDRIEFVEVSSELGVQLLFFTVDPIARQPEQWAWIELSEGRSLAACFRNENGPTLHVVYKDPALKNGFVTADVVNTHTLSSPLFVVPAVAESPEPNVAAGRIRSWTRRLVHTLRRAVRRPLVAEETATRPGSEMLVQSLEETDRIDKTPFLALLGEDRKHSQRRLALLVVLVSASLVVGLLFFKTSVSPELTATALLESARITEQAQQVPDKVRHRLFRLEERRSSEGAVVARRNIEIWENRASGNRAQRLYDESNKLIAGTWQKPDGLRTVYHHGSKPRPEPAPTSPDNLLLLNLEDVWQLEPSVETFIALIAEPAVARVEERSTTYVLYYDKERTIGASRLLKATLTLNKSDLHAIEQTLIVQRGGESREYRFVEASFELLPLKAVAPTTFDIEPELTGGAGQLGEPGNWAIRDLTSSRVPPSSSTSTPSVASAELEVDVAYLLNQAKADRNEQVALTRSAGGSLRVEGIVDTEERKNEFLRVLGPVSNNPAVKIDIRTVAEAMQHRAPSGSVSVYEPEETANTIAADAELRAFFDKSDPGGSTDEAIRSYASQVVNGSYRALFRAIELKKLISRFANVDMRTVAPDARAKWLKMLHEHAAAFQQENAVLRQEIEPVFFPGPPLNTADEALIESDEDLARAIERIHKLALSTNDAIRSAFTTTSQSSASAIKSIQFRRSLVIGDRLVARVRQYEK